MLATIFILFAAPFLAIAFTRLLALRAIPLCLAGLALWGIGTHWSNWPAALLAAICIGLAVSVLLEELRWRETTRAAIMLLETASGVTLSTLFIFAVFYSTGTRGVPLAIALASGAGIALFVGLQRRTHFAQ